MSTRKKECLYPSQYGNKTGWHRQQPARLWTNKPKQVKSMQQEGNKV